MTDATRDIGAMRFPKRELRRRLAVLLSLVLVVSAAIVALFIVRGVDVQMRNVSNSYEVRRQARELIQGLLDAETGQRGYLLTQDDQYLDPYRSAVTSMDATYRRLAEMVADHPARRDALIGLNDLIEQKRAEMASTITLVTGGRVSEALTILRSGQGRLVMERIREQLGALIAEEDAKLIAQNTDVAMLRGWLIGAIVAALGGAVILTYALLTRTQREVRSLALVSSELQLQNVELERRVQERTAQVEEARAHAERERARVETLLQDTNHRIGNSLATVSSLLGLQVARTGSEEVRSALEAAQSRVQAIASGHRRLRLGADLETTNAAEFLAAVVEDLQSTQAAGRPIVLKVEVEPMVISARDATTVGIIVGELVINALKHAFPGEAKGTITVRLERTRDEGGKLTVEDDGAGISADAVGAGLGAMIIRQLAQQFGGEPKYEPCDGGGTRVVVLLPRLQTGSAGG